jgi:hypothetical protein
MVSSGKLRRVALVRTDVSEERSASFIWVHLDELGTTLAVTTNRRTLALLSVLCKDILINLGHFVLV